MIMQSVYWLHLGVFQPRCFAQKFISILEAKCFSKFAWQKLFSWGDSCKIFVLNNAAATYLDIRDSIRWKNDIDDVIDESIFHDSIGSCRRAQWWGSVDLFYTNTNNFLLYKTIWLSHSFKQSEIAQMVEQALLTRRTRVQVPPPPCCSMLWGCVTKTSSYVNRC